MLPPFLRNLFRRKPEPLSTKPECLDTVADRKFIQALDSMGIAIEDRIMIDGEWQYYAAVIRHKDRVEIKFASCPSYSVLLDIQVAKEMGEAIASMAKKGYANARKEDN